MLLGSRLLRNKAAETEQKYLGLLSDQSHDYLKRLLRLSITQWSDYVIAVMIGDTFRKLYHFVT